MIKSQKIKKTILFIVVVSYLLPGFSVAQSAMPDSLLAEVTLSNAITYAIRRQPAIQQAQLNEEITSARILSKLADWYPQVNFNFNLQHNFIVNKAVIGGNIIKLGASNTSAGQFTATQNIFNRDALLAKKNTG